MMVSGLPTRRRADAVEERGSATRGGGAVTLARRGRGGGAGARREAAVHEKALAVACDVGGGCQGRAQWVVQVGPRKKPSPSKQRKP